MTGVIKTAKKPHTQKATFPTKSKRTILQNHSYVRLNGLWTVSIRLWYDAGENKKKSSDEYQKMVKKKSDATQQVQRSETYQMG